MYRKIHTDPAKKWLSELEAEDVPLKVCLTHADRLYAELMETDDNNPDPTEFKKQKINEELDVSLTNVIISVHPPVGCFVADRHFEPYK